MFFDMSAARAFLAGWIPAVVDKQLTAVQFALVGELDTKLAESSVAQRTGQLVVFKKALDVQILDADAAKVLGVVGGRLVDTISADVGNPGVQASDLGFGDLAPLTALLAAR